jgi:DNA-binding NarL/FixJ family response regulator
MTALHPSATRTRAIRVAVLDRYPVARAGFDAILRAQSDLAPAGAVADEHALWPLLYRARPEVVLLEHDPGSGANLALCLRIKAQPMGPRVVICAAEAGTDLIVPATVAGADAIVDKAGDARDLVYAIRAVARGERMLPGYTSGLQVAAAARLGHRDRAIFAMRLAGTAPTDIAAVVGLSPRRLEARTAAIVAALATRAGSIEPPGEAARSAAVAATGAPG